MEVALAIVGILLLVGVIVTGIRYDKKRAASMTEQEEQEAWWKQQW